jgi:hypothetical protein
LPRRAKLSANVSARRFNFDDLGTHVTKLHTDQRACADLREIKYLNPTERLINGHTFCAAHYRFLLS